ncbi:hypothetical protein BDW60DRAFT_72456 [Aspergillus nidulans var. acristatus]
MSRSGASKHPGSRLARLIIAAQGTRFPVRSCTLLYASYALVCSSCAPSGRKRLHLLLPERYIGKMPVIPVLLLSCFTTSSFTASREVLQVVARHAAREKLLDRRSIAYQISRRWIFDYGRSHRLSPFGATWRRERVQFLHVAYLDSLEIRDHLESAQSGVMQLCICQSGLVRTSVWENGDETEQNGSGSADHLPSGCTFPRGGYG